MKEKQEPSAVLDWLTEHFPALADSVEPDRNWLWLADVDLRGESNKAMREALKLAGFRWAKGGHPLPSGRVGIWGHSCLAPTPFRRRGKGSKVVKTDFSEPCSESDAEAMLAARLAAIG